MENKDVPKVEECDHSKNTNFQLAQSAVDLGGKILLLISCKCSECKNIHMVIKEIPLGPGISTTTPIIADGKGGRG